ncbi:MAG: hypothetical protein WCP98_05625 [Actinomycetes bacterium]
MPPKDDPDDLPDDIVEEVRAVRRAHAEACAFDLARMFEDVKRREVASGAPVVSLPPRLLRARVAAGDHDAAEPGKAPDVRPSSPAARSGGRG